MSNAFKHSHYFSLASCPHTRRRPVQSTGTGQSRGKPQTVGSHLLSQWEHLLECSIFFFFSLFFNFCSAELENVSEQRR